MSADYGADLAYIHDAGFSDYALGASPGVLAILRRHGIRDGLVVDLGCGSGRWAAELVRHGYGVLGVDRSAAFLRLARRHAPVARFREASLWDARLPRCDAITALGECINYRPCGRLSMLFARARNALRPGGVLIFDAAGPSRLPAGEPRRNWREGEDWAVLAETSGRGSELTRRIVCYRRLGARYRRSEETHRLRLYEPDEVLAALGRAGFHARASPSYGRFRLPDGITAFIAAR